MGGPKRLSSNHYTNLVISSFVALSFVGRSGGLRLKLSGGWRVTYSEDGLDRPYQFIDTPGFGIEPMRQVEAENLVVSSFVVSSFVILAPTRTGRMLRPEIVH